MNPLLGHTLRISLLCLKFNNLTCLPTCHLTNFPSTILPPFLLVLPLVFPPIFPSILPTCFPTCITPCPPSCSPTCLSTCHLIVLNYIVNNSLCLSSCLSTCTISTTITLFNLSSYKYSHQSSQLPSHFSFYQSSHLCSHQPSHLFSNISSNLSFHFSNYSQLSRRLPISTTTIKHRSPTCLPICYVTYLSGSKTKPVLYNSTVFYNFTVPTKRHMKGR